MSGGCQVIFKAIMHETKDGDNEVQEQERGKEEMSLALVDHPQTDPLGKAFGP